MGLGGRSFVVVMGATGVREKLRFTIVAVFAIAVLVGAGSDLACAAGARRRMPAVKKAPAVDLRQVHVVGGRAPPVALGAKGGVMIEAETRAGLLAYGEHEEKEPAGPAQMMT